MATMFFEPETSRLIIFCRNHQTNLVTLQWLYYIGIMYSFCDLKYHFNKPHLAIQILIESNIDPHPPTYIPTFSTISNVLIIRLKNDCFNIKYYVICF